MTCRWYYRRPSGFEFRILCLEGSVVWFISPSWPSLAYMCTKVAKEPINFISFCQSFFLCFLRLDTHVLTDDRPSRPTYTSYTSGRQPIHSRLIAILVFGNVCMSMNMLNIVLYHKPCSFHYCFMHTNKTKLPNNDFIITYYNSNITCSTCIYFICFYASRVSFLRLFITLCINFITGISAGNIYYMYKLLHFNLTVSIIIAYILYILSWMSNAWDSLWYLIKSKRDKYIIYIVSRTHAVGFHYDIWWDQPISHFFLYA